VDVYETGAVQIALRYSRHQWVVLNRGHTANHTRKRGRVASGTGTDFEH
jgi:hypothetical protein